MPVLKPVRGIRLNKSHPLARGLVGYWLFNEGSGNKVFDLSGNGNTGTFVGDVVWTPGQSGNAIYVPGSNDYINCGNGSTLNPGASGSFTIVARILWNGWGESNSGRIVSKRDNGNIDYIYYFDQASDKLNF